MIPIAHHKEVFMTAISRNHHIVADNIEYYARYLKITRYLLDISYFRGEQYIQKVWILKKNITTYFAGMFCRIMSFNILFKDTGLKSLANLHQAGIVHC